MPHPTRTPWHSGHWACALAKVGPLVETLGVIKMKINAQNTTKRARGGVAVVRNEQVAGVGRSIGRAGRRGAPSRQSPGRYDRAPPPPFAARSPAPRPWTTSASCTATRRRTCAQACAHHELAREAPCCARMRAPRARKSPAPGATAASDCFGGR